MYDLNYEVERSCTRIATSSMGVALVANEWALLVNRTSYCRNLCTDLFGSYLKFGILFNYVCQDKKIMVK